MAKEKAKRSIFKRWWFWVIVVILVAAIGSNGSEEEKKDTAQQATAQPKEEKSPATETKQEAPKEEKKEEKKGFGIGDTVKVGDMVYTVNSKTTATSVGPSALPTEAKGKFLVIDLKVKNNSDKSVTVDSSFFKLKHDGKTFEADAAGSMSANQGEDGNIKNSFFLEQLNPDLEMGGKIVFDLSPETVDASDLQLQVQTGAFGTETELINLK
ncbi:DUF4352 domain-containing protein [Priestia megaterium]|uniref:DUF4352 domain-containing protein n=1 Tax=Priestia megaterium TaxID=1404 RepID=UPI001A93E9DB|nr:DUF4352 domain-containing protein [Priestia megaterium]QSX20037.1 DUF4352 domain-containing protein [Priestia megaterium]